MKINLLPWREWLKRYYRRQFLIILAATLLSAAIIIIAIWFYANYTIHLLAINNQTIAAKIAKLIESADDIKFRTRYQVLQHDVRLIKSCHDHYSNLLETLHCFGAAMPPHLNFTSITKNEAEWVLQGLTQSSQSANELLKKLPLCRLIDHIKLISLHNEPDNLFTTFIIQARDKEISNATNVSRTI